MVEFEPSRKLSLLIKLISFKEAKKNAKSLAEFERYAKFTLPQQDTRAVLKILINNNILIKADTIYGITRYKLDLDKLEDFIEETPIGKLFREYFDNITNITL